MEVYVKNNRKNTCGILEFRNPAGNSLQSNSLTEIRKILLELEADSQVKVIIIQSVGSTAFCGGASLKEMKRLRDLEQATKFFMGFADVINTLRKLSKFVIARVHGKVVGGGVGLVAACDYAIATKNAYMECLNLLANFSKRFAYSFLLSRSVL